MNMDSMLPEKTVFQNSTSKLWPLMDTDSRDGSNSAIINDYIFVISYYIIYTVVCLPIDIFGTVANIINIICFVKQGFKDSINVTLCGLAISDLGCLVPLVWTNICVAPAVSDVDLPFEPFGFQYMTGCWPHVTFTRITAVITALITLERCLCVTTPLKVRNLLTPKRVSVITTGIFIILVTSMAPVYVIYRLEMVFFPAKNKTLIGLVFKENREITEMISYVINNLFVSFSAFIVIIVCTTILVLKLRSNTKWRKVTTNGMQADNVSSRNVKISKMVVMISALFVVCFVPLTAMIVAMTTEPELSVKGKYSNIAFLIGGLGFILESVNSSMNIFIYYHMSSKYMNTYRQLFRLNKVK